MKRSGNESDWRLALVLRSTEPSTIDGHIFDSYEEGIRWLAAVGQDRTSRFRLEQERQRRGPPCACCATRHWYSEASSV